MAKPLCDMTPAELHAAEPLAINRLASHFNALPPVNLQLDGLNAWMLIGLLQLVLRHPQLPSNPRAAARKLLDELVPAVSAGDAEIALLLRRGEDSDYDVQPEKRNP